MYSIDSTGKFKKDLKLCQRRGYDLTSIKTVIKCLELNGCVPEEYSPHTLSDKLNGYWECHIEPDWLLIYDVNDVVRLVTLVRTGTHSDLLSKK